MMKFQRLEDFARWATNWAGSSLAFLLALITIIVWLITGPLFDFSDTWQLVINTGTTIITFLMVFLIQRTQNKDSIAIQLKLNELLAAHQGASNKLLNVENLTEKEIEDYVRKYHRLAQMIAHDTDRKTAHSVEEVDDEDRGYSPID